nr:MAG TPA: hypothetical protein [Caudoviricetes sp.]DAI94571.1 MAG TPA: hypothetical protein [Caudoviricetes sp.]
MPTRKALRKKWRWTLKSTAARAWSRSSAWNSINR